VIRGVPALLVLTAIAAGCGDAPVYPYGPAPPKNCPVSTLDGYAAVGGDVNGVASPPTTGGGSGPTMMVNNDPVKLAELLQSPDPLVIYVNGMLSPPDTIRVTLDKDARGGNKTLIGVGANSGLTGAGLDLEYSDNIIVRNLKISKVVIGEGDAITLLNSHHVWIDHCDLSSDRDDTTAGYDGLVDITHGSSFITVSWTMFHDHGDTSLVGHTADVSQMEEDAALSVTYHHNGFYRVASGPRVRWGNAHVFNNRFQDVNVFGVVSASDALVRLENNLFELVPRLPLATTYQDPLSGMMTEDGDQFSSSGPIDIIQPSVTPPPLPYSWTTDGVDSAASLVDKCAGTGMLNFGP
jgi:pectate lyase